MDPYAMAFGLMGGLLTTWSILGLEGRIK